MLQLLFVAARTSGTAMGAMAPPTWPIMFMLPERAPV